MNSASREPLTLMGLRLSKAELILKHKIQLVGILAKEYSLKVVRKNPCYLGFYKDIKTSLRILKFKKLLNLNKLKFKRNKKNNNLLNLEVKLKINVKKLKSWKKRNKNCNKNNQKIIKFNLSKTIINKTKNKNILKRPHNSIKRTMNLKKNQSNQKNHLKSQKIKKSRLQHGQKLKNNKKKRKKKK